MPLTSTLFGHWFTRFLSKSTCHLQQPTQTAAPFRAHQFQPQTHEISTGGPNDAQQSPLSNTGSHYSDNSGNVICPPLGNLTGNVANGVNGACAPIPAFRSNTSSASWPLRLPVRANSFPYLPTAWRTRSGSSANSLMPVPLRLSGYVLTRNVPMVSTSLWSRYVYNWMPCSQPRSLPSKRRASCQTGPCQSLQDLRAPARTDGPLRAKPPARVRAVLLFSSQEEDKDFFTSEDCAL